MDLYEAERIHQETFPWQRATHFVDYNGVLGHYQALSCIEHAKGPNVLDLACGDGTITAIFSQHFERVVGVDASAKNLDVAIKRLPKVEFHQSLIEEFNTDERFGSVLMLNILEHVIDPVVTMTQAASFLRDDGSLVVHVPNALAINRRIAVIMGTLTHCEELSPFDIEIAGHRRSYTMASLKADVESAGLRITATGGVFYKMLSTAQMDWFLKNGPWDEGGFGWGRVGTPNKDWKGEFCRACYEIGKEKPEDCNVIFVCATR